VGLTAPQGEESNDRRRVVVVSVFEVHDLAEESAPLVRALAEGEVGTNENAAGIDDSGGAVTR